MKILDINLKNSLEIIRHSLNSVDPYNLVVNNIMLKKNLLYIMGKRFDLNKFNKIHVLGAGKGATYLFKGLRTILGERICGGVIISLKEHSFSDNKVTFCVGSHPIADKKSLNAGKALIEYIKKIDKDDLVFFLITGGASAMLAHPISGIKFEDKVKINKLLFYSGADINEINCLRKHLSSLKGGRLAELIYPTKIISIIISDIVDSPLENIGSGPSIGDSTTFLSAINILHKYKIFSKLEPRVKKFFIDGEENKIPDTPSPDLKKFSKNNHFILGDNLLLLKSVKEYAKKKGIKTEILTSRDKGEASIASRFYASIIKEIIYSKNPFTLPVLLLSGGELTVTLKGKGKGGRNQEFVLSLLDELKNINHPFFILSMGTDGIDGPTDAAGAWIDEKTIKKVKILNLNIGQYLQNNDSYHFFEKIAQLIKIGATGTNVMDLRMFYLQ